MFINFISQQNTHCYAACDTMNTSTKSNALSTDLNSFIYGVSRRNFQNAPELTKIGITLLKNFPAARDAVLEYFAMVFHEAVNVSLNQSDYEVSISYLAEASIICSYLFHSLYGIHLSCRNLAFWCNFV